MSEDSVRFVVNLRAISGELRQIGALLSAIGDVAATDGVDTRELHYLCDNLDRLRDYISLEIKNAEC